MDDELEAMLVEAYQRGWREGCETLLEDEEREGVAAMPHKDAMGEGCGTFVMEISPRLTRIASRLEADEVSDAMEELARCFENAAALVRKAPTETGLD